MGKIFAPPKGLNPPKIENYPGFDHFDKYEKACEEFVEKVKEVCKANGSGKLAGEEVTFPVGDGYARYVVFSLKPVRLIHLEVGDAWHYQYVHRLTATDIRKEIEGRKALSKMFAEAKKEKA